MTSICLTKLRVDRANLRFCLSASLLAELHGNAWFALFADTYVYCELRSNNMNCFRTLHKDY